MKICELLKLIIAKGLKILFNPPALRNCVIDKKSYVCSGSNLNNVKMKKYSYIGNQCLLINVNIGSYCSIADDCYIGAENHPILRVSTSPVFHEGKNVLKKNFVNFPKINSPKTNIENDVWIGKGCYIKAGITIGNGAIIGMGSVVTKNIPPYEIWAGVPAKKISYRFNKKISTALEESRWWEWDDEEIIKYSYLFNNPNYFIKELFKGK